MPPFKRRIPGFPADKGVGEKGREKGGRGWVGVGPYRPRERGWGLGRCGCARRILRVWLAMCGREKATKSKIGKRWAAVTKRPIIIVRPWYAGKEEEKVNVRDEWINEKQSPAGRWCVLEQWKWFVTHSSFILIHRGCIGEGASRTSPWHP